MQNSKEKSCLVAYYSRTGFTRLLAGEIRSRIDCDLEEIFDKKDRRSPIGYLGSIKDKIRGNRPSINPPCHIPADYDIVFIGTPVWGNGVSLPVAEWIKQSAGFPVQTAFFLTTKMTGAKSTFAELETLTGKKPLAKLALKDGRMKKAGWREEVSLFVREAVEKSDDG